MGHLFLSLVTKALLHKLVTQTAGAFLGFCRLKQLGVNRSYLFINGVGRDSSEWNFLSKEPMHFLGLQPWP